MRKFDVIVQLEKVNEAHQKWSAARLEFLSGSNAVMSRLVHEAAANFMSVEEVAKASGFTAKRVREMMRNVGLNPKDGKRLLSKKAAEALANNSALLGIEPHEMDLMSPLAYLPMGSVMKRELQDKTVSQVQELPENERMCSCSEANSSGSLNGGAEVCLTCSYFIKKPVSGNLLARVGAIIAEETSCGYCDGACGACTETAQRIINLVQGS